MRRRITGPVVVQEQEALAAAEESHSKIQVMGNGYDWWEKDDEERI